MDLQLKGRVALVTGGSKGLGASFVRLLAQEGARVVFCARASAAMTALEAEVCAVGGECVAMPVDVFDADAIKAVVEAAAARWGAFDILVNNVGGAHRFGGFEELADDDWTRAYEFNVLSVVRFTRAALPHLRASTLKRVINVSSISALQPGGYNPHYTVTKAAVVNLGKHLANLLAKERILVNTVCAGPVHSESWEDNVRRIATLHQISVAEANALIEKEEAAKIPLGVVGEGAHIASAVAMLASPLSDWTTGSCVHVNGGKMAAAL
jgi:3-oxoacyl-[acyl-carrier protein] reductase